MTIQDNAVPRLSWWMWLFHPIRSYWIMFLVHEALRFRAGEQARQRAATHAEKVVANRAIEESDRKVRGTVRHLRRLADKQDAALRAAQRERSRRDALADRRFTPRVTGEATVIPPLTVEAATELLARRQQKIDADLERGDTRHLDAPSKPRRIAVNVLLGVDVAAIFSLFALLFNIDLAAPDPVEVVTAGGFSTIAALVLGMLAHSTGHMAWQWKVTVPLEPRPGEPAHDAGAEFPPRKAMLVAKLLGLFVVSVLSGFSILMRIVNEATGVGNPVVGWVLGLLVGVAAVVAPWLVVIDEMRSGSIEVRTVDALTKMVQGVENLRTRHLRAAEKNEDRVATLFWKAESAVTAAESGRAARRAQAEKIILMARSLHTGAGRYAFEPAGADESADPDVLAPLFDADLSALGRALARLVAPTPAPEPDEA